MRATPHRQPVGRLMFGFFRRTEEFVAAGDFLCYKFPTWSWEAGDANKRRDFLPATKQYLISRNGASPLRGLELTPLKQRAQSRVFGEQVRWSTRTLTRTPRR